MSSMTSQPSPVPDYGRRHANARTLRILDGVTYGSAIGGALFMIVLLILFLAVIGHGAMPAIQKFGLHFLTGTEWNAHPAHADDTPEPPQVFGARTAIVGTLFTALIALVISFPATKAILASHGFPRSLVTPFAAITSLMDIGVGLLIAFRRTCAIGLIAGIVVSLGYMSGTAILTPDLWIEPLGALVKTGPAIVLMVVALLTLDNR